MRAYGFYYDGLSSDRVLVEAYMASGLLVINGPGVAITAPLAAINIEEAVGGGRSVIRFADGGMFAFDDTAFSDMVFAARGKRTMSTVSRMEKSLYLSITALLIVAAIVTVAVRYGVPLLSHRVAFLVPPDIEKRLGEETLATLDKFVFKQSDLPEEDAERLRLVFHDVALEASFEDNARLLFRKGGSLGANAVAIPSGIVVMTDELVVLAGDDMEIASVMAHEIGHVRERHGLRHLLQNSFTALIVSAAIGDLASISSLAATAPTLLINAKYSRDFEREADAATALYLYNRDIPVQKFVDMLERLEADHKLKTKEKENNAEAEAENKEKSEFSKIGSYLSSHPPVRERIKEVKKLESTFRQDGL
ncbi:MAG: M48 family metallopeptidase [Syntrophorhabdaceae bacterium]|nr:M48 family metallopeptidase [Syntrophorhabdaceae bacterium]